MLCLLSYIITIMILTVNTQNNLPPNHHSPMANHRHNQDPEVLSSWLLEQQERMIANQPLAVSPFASIPEDEEK